MNSKEKQQYSKLIILILFWILILIVLYFRFVPSKETYASEESEYKNPQIEISNAKLVNLDEIIEKNSKNKTTNTGEIYEKQEELEYITKYRNNDGLYVGTTEVFQEGRNGIQTITMKRNFDAEGNLINEEQISAVVTKASINKIIDVGTKIYVAPPVVKQEVLASESENIGDDLKLNSPSGFTLEQFKTMLTDPKDKNKIFEENAEYFYYIEDQYNINGIFVAAVGIHESAWGTSKIALNKNNLFGYGAYDSNPYNGAYTFSSYSESIDLLARVLVKYYLNPPGTIIYDGQKASGQYYNGSTILGVNKKYATDKNWASAVEKYMQYLYNKI